MSIFNFDRMRVASTDATVKFLEYIPGDRLKDILVSLIKENGLTFAEEDFISKITDRFTKEEISK